MVFAVFVADAVFLGAVFLAGFSALVASITFLSAFLVSFLIVTALSRLAPQCLQILTFFPSTSLFAILVAFLQAGQTT